MSRLGAMGRATAEFAIIVVGVLVALGVDSWAQDRADREREILYLQELRSDLRGTVDETQRVLDFERSTLGALNRANAAMTDRPLPRPDSLVAWFERALRSPLFRPGAPTADALIETGDLTLIEDPEIRRLVATYRQRVHHVSALYDVLDRTSLDMAAAINRRTGSSLQLEGDLDWSRISTEPEIRGGLRTQRTAVESRIAYTEYLLLAVSPLLEALEHRLGSER